jgi:hypothetical protein
MKCLFSGDDLHEFLDMPEKRVHKVPVMRGAHTGEHGEYCQPSVEVRTFMFIGFCNAIAIYVEPERPRMLAQQIQPGELARLRKGHWLHENFK